MKDVVLCRLHAKVYIHVYYVSLNKICLEKDILYMSITRIQVKTMKNGEKNMKKVFTTNWYLQKVYFSPISAKGDSTHTQTEQQTDV